MVNSMCIKPNDKITLACYLIMMQITTRIPKMYKTLYTKYTSLLEEAVQHVHDYQNCVSCCFRRLRATFEKERMLYNH